jgi:hypothetical protein
VSPLSGPVSMARRRLLFDLLALGLLALATAGFFWQILFAGAWMPAGGGDLGALLYPTYHFAAQSLKSGVIPFWNPYLYSGAPFAADIQSSLFYPVNLIYFGLAPEVTYRGVMLLSAFHFWLAGVGMYLFLRYLTGSDSIIPPLFGALAFMFSGYFVVHFGNLNLIAQVAWLPFIFLFYHRSLSERRPGFAVWAGGFLAIAASAGHVQPLLIIMLGLTVDLVYHLGLATARWWRAERRRASGSVDLLRVWYKPLASLVITFLVGLGLSALVLIPAYEMTGYTLRAEYNYAQASAYSLAPAQLVGALVPGFFGRDPATHWGAWDRVEVGYVGVLTLLLAVFALLLAGRVKGSLGQHADVSPSQGLGESERVGGFSSEANFEFLWLAVVALLLAMGGYTLLHGWLFGFVPGFGGVRAPARFVFLVSFALATLGSLGLDALMRGPEQEIGPALRVLLRVAPWVIGAVTLFAIPLAFYAVITSQDKDPVIFARTSAAANGLVFFAGLLIAGVALFFLRQRGRLRPAVFGALAVGLLFFDLVSLGSNVDVGYEDPTQGFDHPAIIDYLQSDPGLYRIDTRTEVWHVWQPNTSLLHGVFDVSGLINPLALADYERYLNSMPSRSSFLFDFLNAKYLIASKDVALDWEKFVTVFDADPALNVYLNRDALPRALVVHHAIAVPDHEAAFAATQAPDFDPATTVIVEEGEALDVTPEGGATIGFEAYGPNEIRLRVDTPADSYLVLSEVWYPGWRVTVDGAQAPLLRANYAFRAVRLGPGQHQVHMSFTPRSWRLGLAVSGLTLLVLVGWGSIKLARMFLQAKRISHS